MYYQHFCNSRNNFSKAIMIALIFEIIYFRKSRHWAFESQFLVVSLLFALKTHRNSSQFDAKKKYFVWKINCLKIEIKHCSMSHLFENCDMTLYEFSHIWKLRWNITRCFICLKIELWHYTISLVFWDWDETLLDVLLVWKMKCDIIRIIFCFEIEMWHYTISFSFENWDTTLHCFFVFRLY